MSKTDRLRHWARVILVNALVFVGLLGLTEAAVHHALIDPGLIPDAMLTTARQLYWQEKDLIQFSPWCAQYDEHLTYTLRPGACMFTGPEFSNVYEINSLGLRDDEESLDGPEIIVIGDSHAMGWGVDQNDTFAQILERNLGVRVLNAGISSYGTAREIANLKRLDRSRLKALVIQYCGNDVGENRDFEQAGNKLVVLDRRAYQGVVEQQRARRYAFGDEVRHLLQLLQNEVSVGVASPAADTPSPIHTELADLFLNVLAHGEVPLDDLQIIVFEANNNGFNSSFVPELRVRLEADRNTVPLKFTVLDTNELLRPDDYYRLDGHLNASGHRKMAEAIGRVLARTIESTTQAR